MTIQVTGKNILNNVVKLLRWIKWPISLLLFGLILSPRFWDYWRKAQPEGQLIFSYVNSLKWPVLILILFIATKKYIPSIIDRIEEITFAKLGVKLKTDLQPHPDIPADISDNSEPAIGPLNAKGAEDNKDLEKELTSPQAQELYKTVDGTIYGTQILILKRLSKNVPEGLEEHQLVDLYEAHVKAARANGQKPYTSIPALVQYLIDASLVIHSESDRKYKITYYGLAYLGHLIENQTFHMQPPN